MTPSTNLFALLVAGDYNEIQVRNLQKVVKQVTPLFKNLEAMNDIDDEVTTSTDKIVEAITESSGKVDVKKVEDMGLSYEELFRRLDQDNSGMLDMHEFKDLLAYYGLNPTQHQLVELFSKFDEDASGLIDLEEFRTAIDFLTNDVTEHALVLMGLDPKTLYFGLFIVLVFLSAFFVFIFCGIAAFENFGSFQAVINSFLPVIAGMASNAASTHFDLNEVTDLVLEKVSTALEYWS